MNIVIFDNDETEKIITHFVSYGFESYIVFKENELFLNDDYYKLNNISLTIVRGFNKEKSTDRLEKIKGSLEKTFFVVYSSGICQFDLDNVIKMHKESQVALTALQSEDKLSAMVCENEVFDLFSNSNSLEKEVARNFAEQGELLTLKADI